MKIITVLSLAPTAAAILGRILALNMNLATSRPGFGVLNLGAPRVRGHTLECLHPSEVSSIHFQFSPAPWMDPGGENWPSDFARLLDDLFSRGVRDLLINLPTGVEATVAAPLLHASPRRLILVEGSGPGLERAYKFFKKLTSQGLRHLCYFFLLDEQNMADLVTPVFSLDHRAGQFRDLCLKRLGLPLEYLGSMRPPTLEDSDPVFWKVPESVWSRLLPATSSAEGGTFLQRLQKLVASGLSSEASQ